MAVTTTTVSGANGSTETVPTSAVTPPETGPLPGLPGNGVNPTATTKAPTLTPAEARSTYSTGYSGIISSEHREQGSDLDEVKRVDDLMGILKSLTDGTFKGGNSAALGDLAKKAHLKDTDQTVLNGMNPGFWQSVGARISKANEFSAPKSSTLSPAGIRALRTAASQAIQAHLTNLGVQTGGASSYTQLSSLWGADGKELAQQAQLGRGQTQPLQPLERTSDLIKLLGDLETGKSTSDVNPEVYRAMVARSGQPSAFDPQATGANASTGADHAHLSNTVADAIRTHLAPLVADPAALQTANSAAALEGLQLKGSAFGAFSTEGFDLKNTTTVGSLIANVQKQAVQTPGGLGVPGASVITKSPAQTQWTGEQAYASFQQQWNANKNNYRERTTATLNASGMEPTVLQSSNYGQVASAFVKALQQTPAGGNVWKTIDDAAHSTAKETSYANPAVAQVEAEAHKIGVALTPEETNHIAALYGGAAGAGSVDALNAAVAGYYTYDAKTNGGLGTPGSLSATAIQSMRDEYGKYGLKLSTAQAGGMVEDMMHQGGTDLSSLYTAGAAGSTYAEGRAKVAASALYPSLAPLIGAGQTLSGSGGVLAPYAQAMAQTLGTNPDSVDVTDPYFIKLVTQGAGGAQTSPTGGGNPGSAGTPGTKQTGTDGSSSTPSSAAGGLKSLDQFQAAVMQDPNSGWQHSEGAQAAYSGLASYLMGSMGFSSTGNTSSPGASPVPSGMS